MYFIVKYTAHPERKTRFTKTVEESGRVHALIRKASPWRNGIIERSNRTDNEECFSQMRFVSSEERRYQHRLWEMQYNCHRRIKASGIKLRCKFTKNNIRFMLEAECYNLICQYT